jgi:hypothetical protein
MYIKMVSKNDPKISTLNDPIVLVIDHDWDLFCRARGLNLEVKYIVEGLKDPTFVDARVDYVKITTTPKSNCFGRT